MAQNPQNQSSPSTTPPPSAGFDAIFVKLAASATLKAIWRSVYAEEYPDAAGLFSFVTMTELKQLNSMLTIAPQQRFLDIGCGQGGLSIWVAEQTGASAVGIDFSDVALTYAVATAKTMGFENRATFIRANAANIPLCGVCIDGAMSTDVLQLTPDPAAVIAEVARILKPNTMFAFTTWCIRKPMPGRAVIPDYRPILERAGFQVELYQEPPDWREQQMAVYRQVQERAEALTQELGEVGSAILLTEANERPQQLVDFSRVLVGARKSASM